MLIVLCALASGAMFYLSQGLNAIWSLGWIAPAPLLWLAYRGLPRWQLLLASLFAFICGQIYVIQCYGGLLPAVMIVPMETEMCGLFALAVLLARETLPKLGPFAALIAFPAFWTASEYLIGLFSIHGSFGSLAYAEASFPAAIQIAALFGLPAVTLVLCVFANAAALLLHRRWKAGAAGLAICSLALVFGLVRLAQPPGPTVRVVALADADTWHAENRERSQASEIAASQAYAEAIRTQRGAQAFVIPEGALQMSQDGQAAVLAPLAAAAIASGARVVAGTYVAEPPQNRAITFLPNGTTSAYAKRHPLTPLEPEAPGHDLGLLDQGYATQICKDMDFRATVRQTARHGVRLMIVPANDFGADGWIHARISVMDGVENGFAVLRSALNGIETISDAQGRILAQTSSMRSGMVMATATVPLGPGKTFYTRTGDVLAWLCVATSIAMVVMLLANASLQKTARLFE